MEKQDKIRLLFVCLGNICRSPAAEGIMKDLVQREGLENKFFIDSAGTGGWHTGELPDARMRRHGEKRGYDFCSRARKFRAADFDDFDYIIVMDEENFQDVNAYATSEEDVRKIRRMTDFSQKYTHDYVPDPYYSGADGFELVLDLLEDATEGFLGELKTVHSL
ncbi:MAG: low molecular weight phosphotyrosine protein phosphatase [Petrimonas sp.]|nr:low molecular weight phosphotyrosine protein phosphatase [Petrimonas sp.]